MEEARDAARRGFARIEHEVEHHPDNALALVWGGGALIYLGENERGKEWLLRAGIIAPEDPVIQFNIACNLARLGELERPLDLLENAARNMSGAILGWLKNDTDLVSLRDHPRFKALVAREEAAFGRS